MHSSTPRGITPAPRRRPPLPWALCAILVGCGGDAAPPPPLEGHPDAGEAVLITGPARIALDSANALLRLDRYPEALAQYRAAARLAPSESAPLLGMLMVAGAIEDSALADSVTTALRRF